MADETIREDRPPASAPAEQTFEQWFASSGLGSSMMTAARYGRESCQPEIDRLTGENKEFRDADALRQRAYGDQDCALCGSRGCAHRERWDFGALWKLAKDRSRENEQLRRYVEVHRLRSRGNVEGMVTESIHGALRRIVGVHPEVCERIWAAVEPMYAAARNNDEQDAAIRALVGASDLCQWRARFGRPCGLPRHPDPMVMEHRDRSDAQPYSHPFTPETTLAAVQRAMQRSEEQWSGRLDLLSDITDIKAQLRVLGHCTDGCGHDTWMECNLALLANVLSDEACEQLRDAILTMPWNDRSAENLLHAIKQARGTNAARKVE